jgi:hypothetical protein
MFLDVDNGASRHMANEKALSKLQNQEANMHMELSDDTTYPVNTILHPKNKEREEKSARHW